MKRRWRSLPLIIPVFLLEAWPVAVLIDSVLAEEPTGDWIHQAFLAVLPESKVGQIVGLVLMTMSTPRVPTWLRIPAGPTCAAA